MIKWAIITAAITTALNKLGATKKISKTVGDFTDSISFLVNNTLYGIQAWDSNEEIVSVKAWLKKHIKTMDQVKISLENYLAETEFSMCDISEENIVIDKVAKYRNIDRENQLKNIYKNKSGDYIINIIEGKYQFICIYIESDNYFSINKEWSEVVNTINKALINK